MRMLRFIKHPDAIAFAGYAAVVLVVFGAALLPAQGQLIFGDDIHRQYFFFRQFFNQWIGKGIFPWWNPYLFGGEPFIANPVVNIWYPVNWLFILLPLNVAYSWHLGIHIVWAMTGMKKMMREFGGVEELGGWVAGLLFGLSGFFAARTFAGHVDVIAAASWMPWTIWAMQKKSVPFAAAVFALQLFSGYQTMAFFTLIAAVFLVRPITNVVLGGLGGVGLAALHILPVQEFFRQSIRTFGFPYKWHAYGSIEWRSLLQLIYPFLFGNQYTYAGPPPNFIEHSMFVGAGGLILGALGAVRALREKKGRFLLVVIFGIWAALGPHAPIDLQYILWKIVPMYHYVRIPARHLILVVFGLAGLAGFGVSALGRSWRIKGIVGAILLVEMVWFARGFIALKPLPETRHDKDVIALLTQEKEPYRILQNFGVWLPERDALDFDSVMSYGIFSATGYDPSILRSYYAFASGGNGKRAVLSHDVQIPYITDPAILDRLNIKYIMVPKAYDPFSGTTRYRLVYEKDSRVYENTTVKPRFFLENGSVKILSYTPNRIVLEITSQRDQPLESSEVWYPGWEAYIDGKKVDVAKSNGVFRTLFVPKGNHTVIYQYAPKIFAAGGSISLLTAALLLWFARKRSTGARRASTL